MTENVGAVLVVGGGIAGLQSSLDLANSGFKVYLLDKSPAIGGVMAQLDKTFPTNDCSMCILSPKLVEAGRHPNIELLTYSELEAIDGEAGNFKARIHKKARFVNENCTGCGSCAEVCPVEFPNEFDMGLGKRNAIYVPFPQAVPLRYTIQKQGLQPCRAECPAAVGAPGYITLVSHGKFYEALQIIKEKLPFPSICGRVCHRPCEKKCERNKLDGPVAIAHIKRFVGDLELKIPAIETPAVLTRAESIAIVGGGPAGLTAAHDLVLKGYHVRIYESTPVLGGMMRFGIPRFRLPKEILEREISDILALGVSVQLNTVIGRNLEIKDLFDFGHKAVFFAIGAQNGKKMNCAGEELEGVFQATEFLKEVNLGQIIQTNIAKIDMDACTGCGLCAPSCIYKAIELRQEEKNSKKKYPHVLKYLCKNCGKCASACPSKAIRLSGFSEMYPRIGDNVVVVGGGNAALDTARTALRLGAKNATIMYRRSREDMPAEPEWEIDETELEGVKMIYRTSIIRAMGEKGRLKAIECIKMSLEEIDNSGRPRPVPIPGSEHTMEVDSVILAIGQEVNMGTTTDEVNLERTPWGTLKVDPITLETNMKGVFSGGDAVVGSGTVIGAIAAGKEAAISIDRYINGLDLRAGRDIEPEIAEVPVEGLKKKRQVKMNYLPVEERIDNFSEVELGYTEKEAMKEANRCLVCGGCADCYECSRNCDANAINHQMEPEEIEIDVGSVILAPGFSTFDPESKKEYGYGRYPNVITSIEFERILNASGPFGGHIQRLSDHKEPKKIAFLQCVGSRDEKSNQYCSGVCCMYSIKEAMIAKEHMKDLETHIFSIDIRAFGKGFDEYYVRARDESGVKFTRSRISHVEEDPISKNLIIDYMEDGGLKSEEFDMIVLAVGMEPPEDVTKLSEQLGIRLNKYKFCESNTLHPMETSRSGIFVCGAFSGPKDIPESVAQASGAAAKASSIISNERDALVTIKEFPPEMDVGGTTPRIGVFVCHCGTNIGGVVDVPSVAEYAKRLPYVVHTEDNLYTCSQDANEHINDMIREHDLNRVVVASCSPRTHEPLFQNTIKEAGLNPYLFEMVNIRDHCSWVHMHEPEKATQKSKDLTRMAVAKAALLEPLETSSVEPIPSTLVIGGGLAGLTAAVEMSKQGFDVDLVERTEMLGGHLLNVSDTLSGEKPGELLVSLVRQIEEEPRIRVHTGVKLVQLDGYVGRFQSILSDGTEIQHGTVIVATGGNEYKPTEYPHDTEPNILTQLELDERMLDPDFKPESAVFINCVGSRNETNPRCSRICCSTAIKNALKLIERNPDAKVYVLFKDIRTFGLKEEYYNKALEKGIHFIRFGESEMPHLSSVEEGLEVRFHDLILGRDLTLRSEIVILGTAIVPDETNRDLAKILKVPIDKDGFFMEAHVKLRPLDFATDGIFVCGLAQSPKFMDETISQAYGAVSRACTILSKKRIEAGGMVSTVTEKLCGGCGTCEEVCPYGAITVDLDELKASSNDILCKGCGSCASACPECAITMKNFTNKQLLAQIAAFAGGAVQ